jgi:hypothetical protein
MSSLIQMLKPKTKAQTTTFLHGLLLRQLLWSCFGLLFGHCMKLFVCPLRIQT